jgi:uncharacterized protein (TIGR00369 family)
MSDTSDPAEFGRQMVINTPQSAALGFEFVSAEGGVAAMRAPYRDDLAVDADDPVIAGGVVTTLLDHACGLAIRLAMTGEGAPNAGQMGSMATLDLRIDYMRPAKPRAAVTAQAHCYKVTRSVAFVRGLAFDDDPADPLATAQAAFALTVAPVAGAPPK